MANAHTSSWSSPVTARINPATQRIELICGDTRIEMQRDEAPSVAADLLDLTEQLGNQS